jgi:phosphohistidine phosphatase SixA
MRNLRIIHRGSVSSLFVAFLLLILTPHSVSASEALWDLLREGGKVVLLRHAPVQQGTESGNPLLRDPSCKKEKNLSQQGRRDAEKVGRRFSEQNIPVSSVMHSPFCRTRDTARIAFGKASPAGYLSLLEILDSDEAALQTEVLNQVIGSYSGAGNLVLVTHEPNIRAVSFELMGHLDFLVVDPSDDGEFEELGVIRFSN